VLLDFWGSWCIPCREGMPHMIELFRKYNKSGLDIIGVAVQEPSPEDWRKAIAKDKTGIWYNIMGDIKSDKINKLYGINIYPTKILIDKNGIIIGRYDGTEGANTLDKKLAEVFADKH
jgi:thiol-disulfide isomerase/thioredoxin